MSAGGPEGPPEASAEPTATRWCPQRQQLKPSADSNKCVEAHWIRTSTPPNLFGTDGLFGQQHRWQRFAAERHRLRLQQVRPLYPRLQRHRYLETLEGVGQDSAAIYGAYIGEVHRFPSALQLREWSGLIPYTRQSGQRQASGLRLTQTGPDLIKTTAYRNAEVARQWDPQIAAIYHRQMMKYGKLSSATCRLFAPVPPMCSIASTPCYETNDPTRRET